MGQRPTIADVAREAGVSKTLASFALNDRSGVSAASKERILEAATRLGYYGDPFARALRTGITNIFGIVVRNMRNPYFIDVMEGAQEAANEVEATIVAVNSNYSEDREMEHVRRLAQQRVSGVAITPVGSGPGIGLWQELCPELPVVVVNSPRKFTGPKVRHVDHDEENSVEAAVAHLASLGHPRLTFLTPPAEFGMDNERIDAFLSSCKTHRVAPDIFPVELRLETVERVIGSALRSENPPTAIITNSDYTAHGIYHAARACGLRIGVDLSVVGYDDLPTSELLDPPLTTLRINRHSIGRHIFEQLSAQDNIAPHREPVEFVRRESTGPYRP